MNSNWRIVAIVQALYNIIRPQKIGSAGPVNEPPYDGPSGQLTFSFRIVIFPRIDWLRFLISRYFEVM